MGSVATPVVGGLVGVLTVGISYYQGPGWLPHDECPFCCWCSGRGPLGDRIESRLASWLSAARTGGVDGER